MSGWELFRGNVRVGKFSSELCLRGAVRSTIVRVGKLSEEDLSGEIVREGIYLELVTQVAAEVTVGMKTVSAGALRRFQAYEARKLGSVLLVVGGTAWELVGSY